MPAKPITRAGVDPTIPFGAVLTLSATNVKVGGQPVALQGSPLTPHGPLLHPPGFMTSSSFTVKANGMGVIRQGDVAGCGDSATGFPTVKAGD